MTQALPPGGEVVCLFQELHQEAERRLRKQGARGKVLSLVQLSERTGIDYRTFFSMRRNSLKQYDAEVVKRMCLLFGIELERFFLYITPGQQRTLPTIGDLALAIETFPKRQDEGTYGTIESLLAERIQEWNASHQAQGPLSFKQLGQLVGLHEQTVAAWSNNTISIYQLAVLARWCDFFETGVGNILHYQPPADLHLERVRLPIER